MSGKRRLIVPFPGRILGLCLRFPGPFQAFFRRGLPRFQVTESMTNSVTQKQPLSPSPTASGDAYRISKPLATGNTPMNLQKTQCLAGFRQQSKILDQKPVES